MQYESKRDRAARYYRVATRFWTDERVKHWPDPTKLLAIYLLTNRHRTIEGLYSLPIEYIVVDTGWALKQIQTSLDRLIRDGFMKYDPEARIILIVNALRYQVPELPNVVEGVIRRLKELPKTKLLRDFLKLARKHCSAPDSHNRAKTFLVMLQSAFPSALASTRTLSDSSSDSSSDSDTKHKTLPLPRARGANGRTGKGFTLSLGEEAGKGNGPEPIGEITKSVVSKYKPWPDEIP